MNNELKNNPTTSVPEKEFQGVQWAKALIRFLQEAGQIKGNLSDKEIEDLYEKTLKEKEIEDKRAKLIVDEKRT